MLNELNKRIKGSFLKLATSTKSSWSRLSNSLFSTFLYCSFLEHAWISRRTWNHPSPSHRLHHHLPLLAHPSEGGLETDERMLKDVGKDRSHETTSSRIFKSKQNYDEK